MLIDSQNIRRAVALLVLLCMSGLMGGCGAPLNLLAQRRVPAMYEPAREPMLVLVENYANPSIARFDSEQLSRRVHDKLDHERVAPLIEPVELHRLRERRPEDFHDMSTAAIGREVGARQVLYIDLTDSRVEQAIGSNMARGQMAVQVRIIDVETGETRWPDTAEGYPILLETPPQSLSSARDESAVRQQMHEMMAVRIGRLFSSYVQ